MPPASRKRTASQGPRSGADIATDGATEGATEGATDGATDRNSRREQRTTRGQSPSSTSPALLSDVWLLRARPFDGDVRSKEATELRAYLVAGRTYVVGSSAKAADVIVKEDKTVSRTHATLRVVARGEETIGEKKTRSTGSKRSKRSKKGGDSDGGNTADGVNEGNDAYVEVVDTSSHGRTYLSDDMRSILKARRIRDMNGEGSAQAYHGYFLMLGQMSPFRLTRVQMGVCMSGKASASVERAIGALGVVEVEASGRMRRVAANTRVVVGDASTSERGVDAVVDVRDDILLGMALGVPVVTGDWARAWVDEGRVASSAPREGDYGVSVVGRNGMAMQTAGFEREKVKERLSGLLGGCRLGCVEGDVSRPLAATARALGLAVDVVEGRDGIEEWVVSCSETPLMVLRKQSDVRRLPQPPCAYCLVEDLRLAFLDGETAGLVRRVGEPPPSRATKGGSTTADVPGVTHPLDEGDGWHTAFGSSPLSSRAAEDTEIDEEADEYRIYTTDAPVIVRERGSKSKKFTKKHRAPDVADREVVRVVGDAHQAREEEKEWVEIERERQAMMEAFDKQGLVVGAKRRAPRR